jgi:hypothetical protein
MTPLTMPAAIGLLLAREVKNMWLTAAFRGQG